MGCHNCSRIEQIVEEKKEYKKEQKEKKDKLEFDFIKARKLVKLLLSEDKLYYKTLNYVLLFNDEQFENLFKGNMEYKKYPYNNIQDKIKFRDLLMKFEDFNYLLFEWYENESKYENLIKLWNSNYCVCVLAKSKDEEIEEIFQKIDITDLDNFMIDFRSIMNSSIDSKAADIKNYLKDEFEDFYSLIQVTDEYKENFEKSPIKNKEILTENLSNIGFKLVEKSLPLVKDYIANKFPNLNILSQIQLKTEMLSKLKKVIFDEVINDNKLFSKGISFETVSKFVEAFKTCDKIMNNGQAGPYAALATTFLNLATSIKTYYDNNIEYNEKTKKYTEELDKIHNDFENHKKEIELLDLDDYEECMKKIIIIGKKINNDKKKISHVIKAMEKDKKEIEENKTKKGIQDAIKSGVGVVGCAIGFFTTGGLAAIPLAIGVVGNGIWFGVKLADLINLNKQLKHFQETKDKESKKYEEMENELEKLMKKYNHLQDRYIPINVK